MKKCPGCETLASDSEKFCAVCGAVLEEVKTCANCGEPMKEGELFCAMCGKSVKPVKKICPMCDTVTEGDETNCFVCGTALEIYQEKKAVDEVIKEEKENDGQDDWGRGTRVFSEDAKPKKSKAWIWITAGSVALLLIIVAVVIVCALNCNGSGASPYGAAVISVDEALECAELLAGENETVGVSSYVTENSTDYLISVDTTYREYYRVNKFTGDTEYITLLYSHENWRDYPELFEDFI